MKRLVSALVAVMAPGLFAFADGTTEEWFAEDAETIAAAIGGMTADGVWSNLTGQVEVVDSRVVLDADDATPVAYRPDDVLKADAASVMLTDIVFDAARGELPELTSDAQAAVAITTNAEGACVFAVANGGEWELTTTIADSAVAYAVKVDFTYADIRTVDYSLSNETEWVSLKSGALNPVAAKKVSTIEFAGSGSFAALDGAYPLPPKGTEGNPWQIGVEDPDDVTAWTNANGRLEVSGLGDMQDFEPSAPWAGDAVTEILVEKSVYSIGANAFAGCTGLKTLVMEGEEPPELADGTVLEDVQIFVPAGAEEAYRTAEVWSGLTERIFAAYSRKEEDLVEDRLYEVEYRWWDAQDANDIAEALASFLSMAPAVSTDDDFSPYRVLDWYEDLGAFEEVSNRLKRLSALCTSCRTGNFIGRNFDWAYDDVEECVMRVPAADGRFASIGIASRFFPEPWQTIFGVEDFLPELTMDGINEKGVAINVNVVPAGDNGATTGTNPGGERLCAGFAVRHVLDAATNAAHAVEILESKDIYSIPFLEFHWMISDSAESYIVECVSNELVVLRAHDARPKMANFYVSHSPSLCEYDVLTNEELTADFHTPHAMGIERYARVSNGLDRVDSVDAMFTNMTNVWYKLKYLPGNEGRYWSDLNGAPVPGGAEGQRFTAFDDTYELCVARSNAFKSLQANYVAVTNYEARYGDRAILYDDSLTNQVVHTVHTSIYDLGKRTLRVCVQEDCQSRFDYALDPVWVVVSADRTRKFTTLSAALATLADGDTLMPAVAGESDLSMTPTTFSTDDFNALAVDCPFVVTNNDVTVDFRGRVLRDSYGAGPDGDFLVDIVGATNVTVRNGFLFGTTWREGYEYAPDIDHRGFAVADGARVIVSNCVVFIAATSNSVSVTGGSRLRFVNCWVDGQGDGAEKVFRAADGSRLRFVDTKGFWNPKNFWGVTDGVVDTLAAITGEQFALEDSYLCLDNTIVSNTVTHWSDGKVATPVSFSGTGNALILTNDAFITAITGGVAVAKIELADAGTRLDSNADFVANDEIVCGFAGGAVKKSGSDDAFTYSIVTSVRVSLTTVFSGGSYTVSNLTEGAKIEGINATGGAVYYLPIGAHVAIYCIPSPGYDVVGTNPYDIPEVTAETKIDRKMLPRAKASLWVEGHEIAKDQIGVCSWTWHGSMADVLEQMKADGRYNGMQLALAPWLGIDSESLYFGDQEGPEVWDFIKDKIAEGKLNVMSTMINFPGEDYATLTSITNTQGYMYGVKAGGRDCEASTEHWKSNLYYTAEAARLTAELGVKTLTTESGFICIDPDLMFQRIAEICATCQVYGVDFLIESGPQHSQFMTNLLTRLNAAGFHNVGVNFDPGDTALFDPENPVESFNAMKPWIRMIHAKDCKPFGVEGGRATWNEDCVWGDGSVSKDLDFGAGAFLATLNALGYTGDILYERLSGDETLTPARIDEITLAMDRIFAELTEQDGTPDAPWLVGKANPASVTAYTNGTTLVIAGNGAMKDFETVGPWGTAITAVDFGAQVATIGANAFAGCTLGTLTMRGNPPALGGNDLSGVTVVVRADALGKFGAAEGWKNLNYGEAMKVCYDWQNVKTLAPFLHEVWFDDYTFDEKGETLAGVESFSCSSVRNGNFIGRNFDFFLDDKPEFVVHVAANPAKGRLASVAMAMHTGMREDGVTNGQYTASYDLLPNRTLDGINEKGVAINQNVVAYDPEVAAGVGKEFTGTNPGAPNLNSSFVTRMVLDRATNAAHAVELIKSYNIFGISVSGDILHYMISDSKETYVVEIITNTVVARHFEMMTNFAINWDNENARALTDADNEVWTRDYYKEPSNLVVSAENFVDATNALAKYYARHAEGVERFVRLRDNYDEGATFEGMERLMRLAQYSQSSTFETQPYWYSDRCSVAVDKQLTELGYPGIANTYMLYGLKYCKGEVDPEGLLKKSLDEILEENLMAYERACLADKDAHRKENSEVWLTVHNTTYDISNRMFRVVVQENYEQPFDIYLADEPVEQPVTPGEALGPYRTAEKAADVAQKAVLVPSDDVAKVLTTEEARNAYRQMFGFSVTGGVDAWYVEAMLYPEAWTNVVESAQAATLQIPVAELAAHGYGEPLENVPLTNCVPGFFYSLYDGKAVTNIRADLNPMNCNILCGPDTTVVIPKVPQPAPASGFFSIGVLEVPSVIPGETETATNLPSHKKPGDRSDIL